MDGVILKPNKRRQCYALEVNANEDVIVRTPIKPNKAIVRDLLQTHQSWIHARQADVRRTKERLSDWDTPGHVMYRGKKYRLGVSDNHMPVFSNTHINLPKGMDKTTFLNKQARIYLPHRCLDVAAFMGMSVDKVRVRTMRSCWGTCHKNGTITLNQALIQVPDWVSDYIMVHECAHRVHFDHSKAFWHLVGSHSDHIDRAKRWLKDHQMALIEY
ncbi:MAG: M48 family metallopeptidase [Candidatus Marinamargulisbacteria bacterium]